MKYTQCVLMGILVASVLCTTAAERPNIIMIMADDIGYSDIGCYGSEIQTPNIDRLSQDGLQFTQCYNMAKCNPTRSSLFSGLYMPRRNAKNAVPFSSVLREAGYYTAMCGKEHFDPWVPKRCYANEAFEDSFVFSVLISFFVRPETGEFETPFRLNGKPVKATDIDAEIQPLYKTDFITDYALRYLDKAADGNRPFFLYLPYHSAHFPLQARPEDIKKYRGTYMKGWDKVREERLMRLKKLGILDDDVKLSPPEKAPFDIKDKMDHQPWDALSDEEKNAMDLEMAVFAGMVDRMDQNIGRVIQKLEEMDQLDNTLILFFSDNGSCPFPWDKDTAIPPGGPESYRCLSPVWANVGNTPFRLYKRYGHEGGCRTPFIAHWPKAIKPGITHSPAHIVDLYPTLLELAGTEYPASIKEGATPELDGTSMVSLFKTGARKDPKVIISGISIGNPMLRSGDWKLVRQGQKPWELYNLADDPTELKDLAATQPERVKQLSHMLKDWQNRD